MFTNLQWCITYWFSGAVREESIKNRAEAATLPHHRHYVNKLDGPYCSRDKNYVDSAVGKKSLMELLALSR